MFVLLTACLQFVFAGVPPGLDKFSYPPQKMSARGIQEIRISGVKGNLTIKTGPSSHYIVRIKHSRQKRFEDWNLEMDRRGNALILEVSNVAYGAQWRHLVKQELWPEFDIEISGPSVPATLSWREGSLRIEGWKAPIEAAFLSGHIESRGMRGDLKLQLGEGEVQIGDHGGGLDLKGEKGKLSLQGVRGRVNLNWLQGTIEAHRVSGEMDIDLLTGRAVLTRVEGRLLAKGVESSWFIQAGEGADVEVKSTSGPVRIKPPKGKVKVFLSSAQGSIQVHKPLSVELRDGIRVVESSHQKPSLGQVFVRTESGTILWQ